MINIKLMNLPASIKGFCVKDIDDYTICINSKYDKAKQKEIYKHELDHINNSDFSKGNVNDIENLSHEM